MPTTRIKPTTSAQQQQLVEATRRAVEKYGEYMTAPDLQNYAGVSATTLYRWRADHIGPEAFPVGRRWRYDTREVVAYVRRGNR